LKLLSALPGWPNRCGPAQGQSFLLVDLETSASRADLESSSPISRAPSPASDRELFHPDFTKPILLMGDEDPLPADSRVGSAPRTAIAR
jgi:hypothetical protein